MTQHGDEKPYLKRIITEHVWNPHYPQEEKCVCGHPYYRHFDTYAAMAAVGCKYCACERFRPVAAFKKVLDIISESR